MKMTRKEWNILRRRMGTVRRFSAAFLEEGRNQLHQFREALLQAQQEQVFPLSPSRLLEGIHVWIQQCPLCYSHFLCDWSDSLWYELTLVVISSSSSCPQIYSQGPDCLPPATDTHSVCLFWWCWWLHPPALRHWSCGTFFLLPSHL